MQDLGLPYEKAIDCLKNIYIQKNPIHKLKTIIKTSELILASI